IILLLSCCTFTASLSISERVRFARIMGPCLILSFSLITLCPGNYSDVYLYWYRQFPDQGPQYILRTGAKAYSSVRDFAEFAKKRFTPQADDTSTVLSITDLELADTAVYLCALQRSPRRQLHKNPDTSLTCVLSRPNHQPKTKTEFSCESEVCTPGGI
uniref:Ig-like domain-containing protein n=1 Tax=Chelydra serpentina TaxID=8475 RepID=A0A8C3SD60_CHESE